MLRCPELKKLPKATAVKSINYRRQTPGSPVNLLSPFPTKTNILDPSHPVSHASINSLPSFRSTEFGIRAYPMALLQKPDVMWQIQFRPFDTWADRVARAREMDTHATRDKDDVEEYGTAPSLAPMLLNNTRRNRISMSYLTVNNKKRTTGKQHIRTTINRRLKHAINLIVVRGADAKEVKGRPTLVFGQHNDKTASDQWILRGWSYLFFPTLHLYRMPYQELIPKLRTALEFIFNAGTKMEKRWIAQIPFADLKKAYTDTRDSTVKRQGPLVRKERRPPLVNPQDDGSATESPRRKAFGLLSPEEVAARARLMKPAPISSADEALEPFEIEVPEDGVISPTDDHKLIGRQTTFSGTSRFLSPTPHPPTGNRMNDPDSHPEWPLSPTAISDTSKPRRWRSAFDGATNTDDDDDWKPFDMDPPPSNDATPPHTPAPRLLFSRHPSAPTPRPRDDHWRFSDAPVNTTEAEDAWADKYPTSVREMAQRKLFRRPGVLTVLPRTGVGPGTSE